MSNGSFELLIDILPENCSVLPADPATVLVAKDEVEKLHPVMVSATTVLRSSVQKYVPVRPEPHLANAQGIVMLHVTVGGDGRVSNIQTMTGNPILVPKAIDAVRQWAFTPFWRDGVASEFQFDIRIPVKNSAPASLDDVRKANLGD